MVILALLSRFKWECSPFASLRYYVHEKCTLGFHFIPFQIITLNKESDYNILNLHSFTNIGRRVHMYVEKLLL